MPKTVGGELRQRRVGWGAEEAAEAAAYAEEETGELAWSVVQNGGGRHPPTPTRENKVTSFCPSGWLLSCPRAAPLQWDCAGREGGNTGAAAISYWDPAQDRACPHPLSGEPSTPRGPLPGLQGRDSSSGPCSADYRALHSMSLSHSIQGDTTPKSFSPPAPPHKEEGSFCT